ncbi:hypothetical protein, partial [Salmonella enterica]
LWAIYLLQVAITVITESEEVWVFIGAGLLVWFLRAPPKWLKKGNVNSLALAQLPLASVLTTLDVPLLVQIGLFFAKAG